MDRLKNDKAEKIEFSVVLKALRKFIIHRRGEGRKNLGRKTRFRAHDRVPVVC